MDYREYSICGFLRNMSSHGLSGSLTIKNDILNHSVFKISMLCNKKTGSIVATNDYFLPTFRGLLCMH